MSLQSALQMTQRILEYHIKLKEDTSFKTKVLPAMRPDKAIDITDEEYILLMLEILFIWRLESLMKLRIYPPMDL